MVAKSLRIRMKTEAQLARTELELNSVSDALTRVHYYIRPRDIGIGGCDTWHSYCQMLESKLVDEIHKREVDERYPNG
jgi:hypothetical protein